MTLVKSTMDPIQHAKISLYENQENEWVELIQPLNENSPVWKFLSQHPNELHHECYEITKNELVSYLKSHSLIKVMGPVPAKIFDDQMVSFYLEEKKVVEFIHLDL